MLIALFLIPLFLSCADGIHSFRSLVRTFSKGMGAIWSSRTYKCWIDLAKEVKEKEQAKFNLANRILIETIEMEGQ